MTGHDANILLQSQVLSLNLNPPAIPAEHPILLIHLIHSTLLPAPHSPLRLHGVIFMHHQDAGGWWMPAIHTRPFQIQRSTFITGDNYYVLFDKISFHADPVNLFGFGFHISAEKDVFCLIFFRSSYTVSVFALFCSSGATEVPFQRDQTCQVYSCVGLCVKP